jgi:hypothetical protein
MFILSGIESVILSRNLEMVDEDSRGIIKSAISLIAIAKMCLGFPTPILTEDRRILEKLILTYFAEEDTINHILFIGCEYYTWHYKKIFSRKDYWTIDPLAEKARFGAKNHIIGYLDEIDKYFERGSLDLIIFNRVL